MDTKDFNPTDLFHRVTRERMEQIRATLHSNINDMFEKIEYAPDGHALNAVSVETKRDFEALAAPSGQLCHIPKSISLTLKVDCTAAQFKEDLDKAVNGEPPYGPVRNTKFRNSHEGPVEVKIEGLGAYSAPLDELLGKKG